MFPIRYVHKVKGHPSLQKGGCHEVHDIEDLVKVGQVVKGPVFTPFLFEMVFHEVIKEVSESFL